MLKNFFVLSAFSFLLTLGLVAEAQACTCTDTFRPIIVDFLEADAVFSAEVVSVSQIPLKKRESSGWQSDLFVTYKVSKKYKGISESTKLITLEADYKASSCGFAVDRKPKPKVGQKWIVFANRTTKSPQLVLTGTCGKSSVLESKAEIASSNKEMSELDTRPGIALTIFDSDKYLLVEADKVELKNNKIKISAEKDERRAYYFRGLAKDKYTVSIYLPFSAEPVQFSKWIDVTSKTEKDEATGKVRTVLTYEIDFEGDSYQYNQIQIAIDR